MTLDTDTITQPRIASGSLRTSGRRPRVLLVDDDPELADELAETLMTAGIAVRTASSGAEAIRTLEQQPELGIVVTDIMLRDFSGFELLRKMSLLAPRRQVRAVVLSGYATVDHLLNALRLGVVDFLPKPVMAEELLEAIRRAAEPATAEAARGLELSLGDATQLLLSARHKRDAIFGADLFEDPAWNIMLDLYLSTLRGQSVAVSDLCVASGTSATTALRRLHTLVDLGLIKRVPDRSDRRRVLVEQTSRGRDAMDRFAAWLRESMIAKHT